MHVKKRPDEESRVCEMADLKKITANRSHGRHVSGARPKLFRSGRVTSSHDTGAAGRSPGGRAGADSRQRGAASGACVRRRALQRNRGARDNNPPAQNPNSDWQLATRRAETIPSPSPARVRGFPPPRRIPAPFRCYVFVRPDPGRMAPILKCAFFSIDFLIIVRWFRDGSDGYEIRYGWKNYFCVMK